MKCSIATTEAQHEVKGRLLLDVVVTQGSAILELFASEDQPLLVWWDSFFILNLGLHILNGVAWFNLEGDGFAGQSFHKDLHSTSQAKHEVKSGFFLNVVVTQRSAILQLFPSEDQPLLVWWDPFFVLNLGLHILNGVAWFNLEGDGFAGQSFHKDLHSTSQAKHEVKSGLFLNVVVTQRSAILQLFPSEDQPLLVWRDSFFVLNFRFHVFNRVTWFNLEGDGFAGQSFHKDLHSTSQAKHEVKSGLFLDIVVAQCAAIFELFACEDETLLVGRNALLVLNFGFHVLDCVAWFNFEGDGFAGQSFHKDLHSTSQAKHEVKSGFFLDIVVAQCAAIFELFACENQPLLVWRDSFFVLNFCFHVFNRITWFNLEGDGFAGQSFHKDLHSTSQTKDKMKSGLFLDIVVAQCAAIFELFACEYETLLVGRNAFLVLNFGFHILDCVTWFDFKGDSLTSQCLHKDLHDESRRFNSFSQRNKRNFLLLLRKSR